MFEVKNDNESRDAAWGIRRIVLGESISPKESIGLLTFVRKLTCSKCPDPGFFRTQVLELLQRSYSLP